MNAKEIFNEINVISDEAAGEMMKTAGIKPDQLQKEIGKSFYGFSYKMEDGGASFSKWYVLAKSFSDARSIASKFCEKMGYQMNDDIGMLVGFGNLNDL